MKILVISQHFYPENFRINEIVKELATRGYEVTVLTGYPNYPKGEIYSGYEIGKPYEHNYYGVNIERVKVHPRGQSKKDLILNYISFARNAKKWVKKNGIKFDICYCCQTSPVFMALPGVVFKKKFKKPLITNVQDLWPESLADVLGIKNKLLLYPIKKLSNKVYLSSDKLLCSSKSFIENMKLRGVKQENLVFWPQFSNEIEEIPCEMPTEYTTRYRFVFTGNIGKAQGLEVVLDCAKILKKNKDIGFYFVGDGSDKQRLQQIKEDNKLDNVIFVDRKPEKEIPCFIKNATASLLCLKDSSIARQTLPAKLQMYMACGSAVISTINGEAGDLIKEANCGLISKENNGECLANTINEFILQDDETKNQFAKNSISFNAKFFNKDNLLNELEHIIEKETKIKILLVSTLPPPSGGIATWTKDYLEWSQNNDLNVDFVNTAIKGKRVTTIQKIILFEELKRNINIIKIAFKKIKNDCLDLIHINTSCSHNGMIRDYLIIKKSYKNNIKVITHCHCNIEDWILKKRDRRLFSKIIKLSSKVIVLNKNSLNFVESLVDNKAIIIPSFINLDKPEKKECHEIVKNIIFVGHVKKEKGCDIILKISNQFPNIIFNLIGNISDEYKNVNLPSNVILHGEKSHNEVLEWLKKCDILLFPTWTEGFPCVVLEAMAFGLPIIATNVGAIPDIIEDKGGILVKVKDEKSIIDAIEKLYSKDLREQMSKWNVDKVMNYYLIDNVMKQYLEAYIS